MSTKDQQSRGLRLLWLELTGKCQLTCVHCYAASSPAGSHGTMTESDWLRVIDQAAEVKTGMVQFIGGEPTLHPSLPRLIERARSADVEVEVFSNLVSARTDFLRFAREQGIKLATSYYSDEPAHHQAITGTRGSARRTLEGITKAVDLGIPLRVGIIEVADGQRVAQAQRQLVDLGVHPDRIRVDRLREVGRGVRTQSQDVSQLCGKCASGVLAISPKGLVWPCVFSRWVQVGDAHRQTLAEILAGRRVREVTDMLSREFALRNSGRRVTDGGQAQCRPQQPCRPETLECRPTQNCHPDAACGPDGNGDCSPER